MSPAIAPQAAAPMTTASDVPLRAAAAPATTKPISPGATKSVTIEALRKHNGEHQDHEREAVRPAHKVDEIVGDGRDYPIRSGIEPGRSRRRTPTVTRQNRTERRSGVRCACPLRRNPRRHSDPGAPRRCVSRPWSKTPRVPRWTRRRQALTIRQKSSPTRRRRSSSSPRRGPAATAPKRRRSASTRPARR